MNHKLSEADFTGGAIERHNVTQGQAHTPLKTWSEFRSPLPSVPLAGHSHWSTKQERYPRKIPEGHMWTHAQCAIVRIKMYRTTEDRDGTQREGNI